jgi:hypothetical protein
MRLRIRMPEDDQHTKGLTIVANPVLGIPLGMREVARANVAGLKIVSNPTLGWGIPCPWNFRSSFNAPVLTPHGQFHGSLLRSRLNRPAQTRTPKSIDDLVVIRSMVNLPSRSSGS